jgi:hypothetical protein
MCIALNSYALCLMHPLVIVSRKILTVLLLLKRCLMFYFHLNYFVYIRSLFH